MITQPPDRPNRAKARELEQNQNLFGRIAAAHLVSRVQAQRLLKSAGDLSITEWRILWDLAEAGPLSVTEMASIQRTDHALISRAIPVMKRRGYVTAHVSKADRRQSQIALTPFGQEAFEKASEVMSARRAGLAKVFSEGELYTFLSLIDRFEAFVTKALPETPDDKAPE